MGIFSRKPDMADLIAKRDELARQIIPVLEEQVRTNPSDGLLHLELVKAFAMSNQLDAAKTQCEAAMLKLPVTGRQPALDLQAEIERLIEHRRLGI